MRVEFKVPVVVVFGGKPEIRWEDRYLEVINNDIC